MSHPDGCWCRTCLDPDWLRDEEYAAQFDPPDNDDGGD